MTNDLEKQFFQCFGIEPKHTDFAIKRNEKGEMEYPPIYTYPQITDRILLGIIAKIMCSPFLGSLIIFIPINHATKNSTVLTKPIILPKLKSADFGGFFII